MNKLTASSRARGLPPMLWLKNLVILGITVLAQVVCAGSR
jgi:hypothetical protein